jgi:hypothetical protein
MTEPVTSKNEYKYHQKKKRWEDSIKMNLRAVECGDVNWIEMYEIWGSHGVSVKITVFWDVTPYSLGSSS